MEKQTSNATIYVIFLRNYLVIKLIMAEIMCTYKFLMLAELYWEVFERQQHGTIKNRNGGTYGHVQSF